jgi:hypothetical protein
MELRQRAADGGSSEFPWGPPTGQCPDCAADAIPADFTFCGRCGASLRVMDDAPVGGVTVRIAPAAP